MLSQIPVYIVNRDRVGCTKRLVDWLLAAGTERVVIVDNASTYPPLLKFYEELPAGVELHQVGRNAGPLVCWQDELHLRQETPFVVTDADVVPSDCCPKDLVVKLLSMFEKFPNCRKVGPGLRTDNIPDTLPFKQKIVEENKQFWTTRVSSEAFRASIDTTFALYRTKASWPGHCPDNGIRMDFPYVAEHTPWYSWPLTEEDEYFGERCLTHPISNIAGYWREAGWKEKVPVG